MILQDISRINVLKSVFLPHYSRFVVYILQFWINYYYENQIITLYKIFNLTLVYDICYNIATLYMFY